MSRVSAAEPDCHADAHQRQRFLQHQPEDRPALRAERYPHADLVRPPAHRKREHAVEPDGRERQRDFTSAITPMTSRVLAFASGDWLTAPADRVLLRGVLARLIHYG